MDENPKQSAWVKVGKVLFWSVAAIAGLLFVLVNWPLDFDTKAIIVAFGAFALLKLTYNDHQTALRQRHDDLARRLSAIDHQLQKIEAELYWIENPRLRPGARIPPQ